MRYRAGKPWPRKTKKYKHMSRTTTCGCVAAVEEEDTTDVRGSREALLRRVVRGKHHMGIIAFSSLTTNCINGNNKHNIFWSYKTSRVQNIKSI